MNIEIASSADVAWVAGQCFSAAVVAHEKQPLAVFVSGGSSLEVMDWVDFTLFEHASFGLVDERINVSPKDKNMTAFQQSEFYKATKPKYFIPLDEHAMHEWFAGHPEAFSIALLGIGEDIHIAGMMRGQEDLFNGPEWVKEYDAKAGTFPRRRTVTNTFLTEKVDSAIVYAVGPEKNYALSHLQDGPARILFQMKDVHLFTDQHVVQ